MEMVLIFFTCFLSLQLSFLCYSRFFILSKKYFLRHLALLSTFLSSSSSSSSFMPIFFLSYQKKKTFPFVHVHIYYALNQPNQVIIFQSFFFSTMHNLSEFFLFRLQVFFPLYLSSCPSFLSSFSFVTYDFFFNLLLLSLSFFFFVSNTSFIFNSPIFIITKRTTATVFRRKANFLSD